MKFTYYRPLKLTGPENSFCFWSDTHFGHACDSWPVPLWKTRGFNSVKEHDETLIERWNKKVSSTSTVFHLGDFTLGMNTVDNFEAIIKKLNFQVLYVMPGNHCSGWKQHFEKQLKQTWAINNNKRVIFIPNYFEIIINDQHINLSHYPIVSFNQQAKGAWMLHGHCHSNLYKSEIGPLLYQLKIRDVGVETYPFPTNFAELNRCFTKQPTLTYDQQYE